MPLSKPASRNMLHLRDISLSGYEREDGLIDIDAHMTDTKTHSFNRPGAGLPAGEPLHDMWLRFTIDRDMVIKASEAVMDATPYSICPGVAPNYQRLVGLRIGAGFIKAAIQRIGGIEGCTHLRELLQQMGTVAFQTRASLLMTDKTINQPAHRRIPPALVNSCYAYDENGPLAARYRETAAK